MLRFTTTIEAYGPAAAIMLTDEQAAELSSAKTPPVVVTIGDKSARLRVTRMGGPVCIGLSKASRAALGVEIWDVVDVEIVLDEAERVVEIPPELERAFEEYAEARGAFDVLSYTRRKEIARGIAEAKQDDTRRRRVDKAMEELRGE